VGDKPEEMFKDADLIVFLGGFPRKPGMERKDLLQINKRIFMEQGRALSQAKADVKCLVIANPANTNAYILSHYAPNVKKENITSLTRLDHNRAIGQIITKTGCELTDIQGVYIFGNHSLTQYPSINNITVREKPISEYADREWLEKSYIPRVQKRGGEILQIRGGSSVFSAAKGVLDHLKDWCNGSNRVVSMGVVSEGDYGIPKGIWSSFPVRCKNFTYEIIKDFPISEFCKGKIAETVKELQE
jgi:malate dehydrogenase